jgi:deaminated glutathione amidase
MFKLALAQMAHPAKGDVINAARTWALKAANAGAQLLVFPECLMTPFEKTPEEFAASAQPLNGAFVQAMGDIAREAGLWLVYTVNEKNTAGEALASATSTTTNASTSSTANVTSELPASTARETLTNTTSALTSSNTSSAASSLNNLPARPFNTAVVMDSDGHVQASYRKTHLYAAHGIDEHEKMSEGSTLFAPLKTPFCTLGLGICYDLRFPEVARAATLAGCNVLLFPAAWVAGPSKVRHWETLLAARAVENELFVAGCCRPDRNCIGHSQVINPLGEVIARAEEGEQLLVAEIDLDQVKNARANMPCFEHRRPELYLPLVQ